MTYIAVWIDFSFYLFRVTFWNRKASLQRRCMGVMAYLITGNSTVLQQFVYAQNEKKNPSKCLYVMTSSCVSCSRYITDASHVRLISLWCYAYYTCVNILQWRHNGRDGVSNHQPPHCLLNRLSNTDQRKHQAPRHWPLCGEFTGDRWIPRTNGQ